ncbi:pseudouridine synthase [Aspergillus ambiguus]|uniref:pseudouridine synthase DEG1 n=1 Tax=Aspergillus ambiguus TaxID=176160 RepID=UPI003CCD0BA0
MSGPDATPVPTGQPDYSTWSPSSLIARITELERQLHSRTSEYASIPANEPASHVTAPDSTTAETATSPSRAVPHKRQKTVDVDDITHTRAPNKPPKTAREMDPSKYHTRFIALKFAYLGQRYNGLEHANGNVTPLPTIEEELWKALRKTRLIFPTGATADDLREFQEPRVLKPYSINWEGCDYSKAGRTDRGVSAFGQVVGIRVRSARPKNKKVAPTDSSPDTHMQDGDENASADKPADGGWDDIADELPYINLLNRVLPEDIRVLAWCPHPPEGFDARFSCRERQYKYFFTQPAFSPTPGPGGFAPRANDKSGTVPKYREGWLDIDAMREAARMFVGRHDFRNFCKLDTSKQIENFERIIYHSDIELVDPRSTPLGYVVQPGFKALEDASAEQSSDSSAATVPAASQVYVFSLQGSAFLWHQVRHMVSVLFLVGQGLESPSIVSELLNVSKNPRKPGYEMASDAPLVLWDCIFPNEESGSREDALEWIYAGDPRQTKTQLGKGSGKFGLGGVVDNLWSVWRQRKIDEILAGSLLDLAISQGDQNIGKSEFAASDIKTRGQKVFYGANEARTGGPYIPIMEKRKMDPVEVQNARWLAAKQRKTANAENSMET